MSYEIISGVLDPDSKGLTGRGTKFWMDIRENGTMIERLEWFLMDEIHGMVDVEAFKRPYIEANKKGEKLALAVKQEEKKAQLEERQAAVYSNPALDTIINTVTSNNSKVVGEYQSGKDKALNSLVGMVIKEVKAQGLEIPDGAFTITTLLKKKFGRQ